ncbi:Lrp/AsnC family transcriptional regulator [Candidatus Micrarchaeota archaeon]|nr:Lrp/AsnC family transcriptional regulator [Candidatus Micrarchaeota archaeon]
MDEIDRKIIDILKKDGSTPLSQIADLIGIPRPTVYLRFNKMKENGIIKGFNLVLGAQQQGDLKAAIITVKDYLLSEMGNRTMNAVGEKLAKRHEVIFAARTSNNTILVVWKGNSFHPSEYREVIGVKEIEAEVFKTP